MNFNEDLEVKLQFCIKVFELKKIPTYWSHCLLVIYFLFSFPFVKSLKPMCKRVRLKYLQLRIPTSRSTGSVMLSRFTEPS